MEKIGAKVNAKINLSLCITGRKGAMHTLDSLMHSVSIFDTVIMSQKGFGVYMDGVLDTKNSLNKVLDMMKEYDLPKVRFDIEKGIPFSAGLGGSSADVAAAVELVRQAFGVDLPGAELGSDVPFMQKGGFARVSGTGENVESLSPLDMHLVIAKGKGGVSTKDGYNLFDKEESVSALDTKALISALQNKDYKSAWKITRNDLQKPAFYLNSDVKRVYEDMCKCTPYTLMSGSGSAVFGVFEEKSDAQSAVDRLKDSVEFVTYATSEPFGVNLL